MTLQYDGSFSEIKQKLIKIAKVVSGIFFALVLMMVISQRSIMDQNLAELSIDACTKICANNGYDVYARPNEGIACIKQCSKEAMRFKFDD